MKEQMMYVAIDTDNVGESVGNAVLQDDEVSLSSLSESINAGTQIFSQWAEFNGGEIISSGSDEAIFKVPVTSIDDLEKLKGEYADKTGFTISIGIGDKVSSAAKALIYAKMNGKDQIIDYSPEIETAMKQNISGELSEEVPEHEQHLDEEGKAIHDATETESDEEEVAEEENAEVAERDQEDEDILEEEAEEEIPGEFVEDDALNDMAESDSISDEDIDLDGRADVNEEHGQISEEDDLDGDGDVEHEEAMAAESGDEEYSDEGDEDDEYLEEGEEIAMEDEDLAGSIEGEMGEDDEAVMSDEMLMEEEIPMEDEMAMEEEIPMEEEISEEDMAPEMEGDDQSGELKSVIYESLQSFKENRQFLEQINQQNPELYNALIHTLQAMIEMARELGFGNMEEEMGQEDPEAMMAEEEMPMEEEVPMEDEVDPEMEEEMEEEVEEESDEEEEEENENPFAKSEKFHSLIKKMRQAVTLMKAASEDEEIKEEIKKKIEAKKKGDSKKSGKKKKVSKLKKPVLPGKKKKKEKKADNDGSFCAKSHNKMRASGKDCRAAEDKDSPLCSARKKMNCRGKNEEKGPSIEKSEKLEKKMAGDTGISSSSLGTRVGVLGTVSNAIGGANEGAKDSAKAGAVSPALEKTNPDKLKEFVSKKRKK
jgi:hypothetical protein